jgi:Ca-activated chloride channel family protein
MRKLLRTLVSPMGFALLIAVFALTQFARVGVAVGQNGNQIAVGEPHPNRPLPVDLPVRPPGPHPVIQRDLTLTDMKVSIDIDGAVARTTIRQTLRNDGAGMAEGQFLLPLAPGATVSSFALLDGDQRLEGKVMDASEARGIYEEIVRQMRDPGLLEYQDANTFAVRAFPFSAGQSRSIEIVLQQALSGTTDMVSYQLPLRWAGWSRLGQYDGGIPFVLTYEIDSDFPLGAIGSPTFGISVVRDGDRRARGSFESTITHFSSDFALNIGRRTGDFAASLLSFPGDRGEDGYFILSLLAALPQQEKAVPKDVLFIFDKSGSMSGAKIDQAKKALRFVVGQLKPQDRFNVMYYSDMVTGVFDGLRDASPANIDQARAAVDGLTADGGTDINSALTQGAQLLRPDGRPTYVVFMTDGQPTVGETDVIRIIANAKQNYASAVKLFVFGVGYDVNTTLLDTLSYDHHGSATYVAENEDIEVKVSQFYAKIASPALIDLALELDGLDEYDLQPKQLPDLFHNNEIFVTGRYRGTPAGSVGVKVRGSGDGGESRSFAASVQSHVSAANSTVPRLWATRKVSWLLDEVRLRGDNAELLGEIDRLAVRFGIVTPYTSYLITEPGQYFAPAAERLADLDSNIREARDDESGEIAVGRSKMSQTNQAADNAAAPQSAGATAGGAGAAYEVAAPPPPSPMAEEQLRRGSADGSTTVNYVRNQTFVRQTDDQNRVKWVDARYNSAVQQNVRVAAYSDEYFELLADFPALGDYLAQGENVTVVVNDEVVLEVTTDAVSPAPDEMNRLRNALGTLK